MDLEGERVGDGEGVDCWGDDEEGGIDSWWRWIELDVLIRSS